MKLSVVIPVFNEKKTVESIVEKVLALPMEKEIILVDDGSNDGTGEVLRSLSEKHHNVRSFFHEINQGKGAALRTGFSQASGDYVIVQDADLEYNPEDILKLLRLTDGDKRQVIYGSRFAGKSKTDLYLDGNMHRLHFLGNKFLTVMTNILYGAKLTDMETCYKLIPQELLRKINIESDRFNFEPEITAKILREGYTIKEVPIDYKGRSAGEGKNISWKDGPAALWTLIKYRLLA